MLFIKQAYDMNEQKQRNTKRNKIQIKNQNLNTHQQRYWAENLRIFSSPKHLITMEKGKKQNQKKVKKTACQTYTHAQGLQECLIADQTGQKGYFGIQESNFLQK